MPITESKKDFEQLIFRLERNHQCVLRTKNDLNSYRFEPKNYECYKKLQELKGGFSKLAENQLVLFDKIQHQSLQFDVAMKKVEESLGKYHELEKIMKAYQLEL